MAELGLLEDDTELLGLLRRASNEDLDPLVHYITRDEDGDTRWTSELELTKVYQRHSPDHQRYYKEIAAEIQLFGGHTIPNMFRGHGVPYREVLEDVASRFKLDKSLRTEELEVELLVTLAEKAFEKMTPEGQAEFLKQIGSADRAITAAMVSSGALLALVRASGFSAYKVAVIVANATAKSLLGSGLAFGTNMALTRGLGILLGPVGLVIQGLWTAYDLGGPAFRVTVPCIIHVAYLRQALKPGRTTRKKSSSSKKPKAKKPASETATPKKVAKKKPTAATATPKKVVKKKPTAATATPKKVAKKKSTAATATPKKVVKKKPTAATSSPKRVVKKLVRSGAVPRKAVARKK